MHTGNLLDKIKRFTKKIPLDHVQIITDHKYVQQAKVLRKRTLPRTRRNQ